MFSLPPDLVEVVEGVKAALPDSLALPSVPSPDPVRLAESAGMELVTLTPDGDFAAPEESGWRRLREVIGLLLPEDIISLVELESGHVSGPSLRRCLERVPVVRRLMELIYDTELLSIEELAGRVWSANGESELEATTLLLRLAAAGTCRTKRVTAGASSASLSRSRCPGYLGMS